jgi:hypothetical protein
MRTLRSVALSALGLVCGGVAAVATVATVATVGACDSGGPAAADLGGGGGADMAAPIMDLAMKPGPVVSSLSKTRGFTKGGDTITITGSGFQSGAVVRFGSQPATGVTVSADGTTITVTAPASPAKPGAVDVVVQNPDSQSSTPIKYTYYLEAISFVQEAVAAGTDAGPRHLAVGDFNKDGAPDLVTANFDANVSGLTDSVTVLQNNKAGGFALAPGGRYIVGNGPFSVTVGDVTGDGSLDVIVPNQTSNDLFVLTGKGDGSFNTAVRSMVPGANRPQWAAISDANNDGSLDLLVANNGNGANTNNVAVLVGNKTATFAGTGTAGFGLSRGTVFSLLGVDLNDDMRLDAVAVHRVDLTQNPITTLINGNKTAVPFYTTAVATTGGGQPSVAEAGDFDGDGKPDIAVANSGANSVSILKNDGAGGLVPVMQQSGTAVGSGTPEPAGIAVGDLDGDGNLDVVTANTNPLGATGDLSIYLGDGTGRLGAAKRLSVALNRKPTSVVVADLDNDGRLDIAYADYRVVGGAVLVLLNNSQ